MGKAADHGYQPPAACAPERELRAALRVRDARHADADHVGVVPGADASAGQAGRCGRRRRVRHRVVEVAQYVRPRDGAGGADCEAG